MLSATLYPQPYTRVHANNRYGGQHPLNAEMLPRIQLMDPRHVSEPSPFQGYSDRHRSFVAMADQGLAEKEVAVDNRELGRNSASRACRCGIRAPASAVHSCRIFSS